MKLRVAAVGASLLLAVVLAVRHGMVLMVGGAHVAHCSATSDSVPCLSPLSADPDAPLNAGEYAKLATKPGVAFTCPPDNQLDATRGESGEQGTHMQFFLKGGGLTAEADKLAGVGTASFVLPAPGGKPLHAYSHYEDWTRYTWERYVLAIVDPLHLRCGHTVFEVGVGSGAFVEVLHRYFDIKAAGTDLSLPLIKLARRALPGSFCAIDGATATSSFLPAGSFDRVIAHSLFYYIHGVPAATAIFKDMVRLCKPGGVVGVMSINTPNTPAGNVGGYGIFENNQAAFTREFWATLARQWKLCAPRFEEQKVGHVGTGYRYSFFVQKPPCRSRSVFAFK
jgi:SAM-dependent methyltransferase